MSVPLKEALFYKKLDDGKVLCELCPHKCRLRPGQEGICMGRENVDGTLYATNYGRVVAINMDPIEKKPLFHFYPGTGILSIAENSCNFKCVFCQNYHISIMKVPYEIPYIPPEKIVKTALKSNSIGIAYTYTEPIVWYEYVLDTAKLAREHNLKNVMITNGFIEEEPLRQLLPYIDAFNVDLKSMDDKFYRRYAKGRVEPVKRTIRMAHEAGKLVEVTNLIIPTLNDSDENIAELVDFIASISADIPLHFSAYHPAYKLNIHPTPVSTLEKAYEIAKKKLHYVYLGNVATKDKENSYCPHCGALLVERHFYSVKIHNLENGRCKVCGAKLNFVQ